MKIESASEYIRKLSCLALRACYSARPKRFPLGSAKSEDMFTRQEITTTVHSDTSPKLTVRLGKRRKGTRKDIFDKSELVGQIGHIENKRLVFYQNFYFNLALPCTLIRNEVIGLESPNHSRILLKTGLIWPDSSKKYGKLPVWGLSLGYI